MKSFALFFIVLGAAALLDLQPAAADMTLECYWCAGYRTDRDENTNTNTKACTLESFNKDLVTKFTNTTTGDQKLACVTASVWASGWNGDEPFTARFAHSYTPRPHPELFGAMNTDLMGEDLMSAIGKADTKDRVFFGVEFCFTALCNTHTHHSGASTSSVPGVALLLLPALALRFFK